VSTLIAIAYPEEDNATRAFDLLRRLQRERGVRLDDAVIVSRRPDGRVKLHQTLPPGATAGALWGGLIGLIFLAPLLGMAVGAASGHAAAFADTGVDARFMKELGEVMPPGGTALIVLMDRVDLSELSPLLAELDGEVIHSSLSDDAESRLQEALRATAVSVGAPEARKPPGPPRPPRPPGEGDDDLP
jgi:uncharacterized membrane protein